MVDYQAWLVQQAGLAKGKTYTENRRRYWLVHIIIMYTWPGLLTSALLPSFDLGQTDQHTV